MDGRRQSAMDWQEFQRSLLKQIPFLGNDIRGKSIDHYVQKAIKNYMPTEVPFEHHFHPFMSKALDYDVFETHRTVFVRCRIPEHIPLKNIKFFANKRKLRMEYPGNADEIPLPSDINPNRTIAKWHDRILEVRMPKLSDSDPFREIFIRE